MDEIKKSIVNLNQASAQLREAAIKLIGPHGSVEESKRLLNHVSEIDEKKVQVEQLLKRLEEAAKPK